MPVNFFIPGLRWCWNFFLLLFAANYLITSTFSVLFLMLHLLCVLLEMFSRDNVKHEQELILNLNDNVMPDCSVFVYFCFFLWKDCFFGKEMRWHISWSISRSNVIGSMLVLLMQLWCLNIISFCYFVVFIYYCSIIIILT